jgi:hypothetical protein
MNFMWQLKNQGKIDHNVVSFYIRATEGNYSTAKFGSYDEQGMLDKSILAIYRTESLSSWGIMAREIQCNHYNLTDNQTRTFHFDTALPYLYMPQSDWINWANAIQKFDLDIECNPEGACWKNQPCSKVDIGTWFFQFTLFDNYTNNFYALPSSKYFMINGDILGDSADTCYLPVFSHITDDPKEKTRWYVGNLIMNYFYLVFDMTPFDEQGKLYIQVGVGPINSQNLIG